VLTGRIRMVFLLGTFVLFALAAPISSASATEAITGSEITSPSSPTPIFYDATIEEAKDVRFTVTGTVTGAASGEVDLRCYYGLADGKPRELPSLLVATKVKVTAGGFSEPIKGNQLGSTPCVLRAVPTGDTTLYPPGEASPFTGPVIVGSKFEPISTLSAPPYEYDYEFGAYSQTADFQITSVGSCGLSESDLFAPGTLDGSSLFFCNAALFRYNNPPSGSPSRSDLQIDGANAYGPSSAYYMEEHELELKTKSLKALANAPAVTLTSPSANTPKFDPTTGTGTVKEVDPIVKCAPETTFPPTTTSCKEFVSTGVSLERTWQTTNSDQVALMTDTWHSTDGAAHTLSAIYEQDLLNTETETDVWNSAYELPGTTAFASVKRGLVSLPSGPGAILYKANKATPSGGDGVSPQGAIIYDTAPTSQLEFSNGTSEAPESDFGMPYMLTIPAGGSVTMRMAFVQAYTLPEVETLSNEVLASYYPALSIAAPTNGATVTSPTLTVSGTATDAVHVNSVTVNGSAVAVGSEGAWSTSLTLTPGANTITAVATNEAGTSVSKSVTVTYTPPSSTSTTTTSTNPPPKQVTSATQVGSSSSTNSTVSLTVSCNGAAGTSCEVSSTVTTVEKTRKGRPIALSAKSHPTKTSSKTVTVGTAKIVIAAGQKLKFTIKLNSLGKSLLAKFGKLPVHLSATLTTNGVKSTILSENLTIKGKPKKHKH
jgi:Glucodextranase, domain B